MQLVEPNYSSAEFVSLAQQASVADDSIINTSTNLHKSVHIKGGKIQRITSLDKMCATRTMVTHDIT